MTVEVKGDMTVADVVARYPSTGAVFLQHGRLYRTRPNNLYAIYDPAMTIDDYASLNALAPPPLLDLLRAAAETDEIAQHMPDATSEGRRERTPPAGAIGYTGSYREPSRDVAEDPFVWVLEAQGPD